MPALWLQHAAIGRGSRRSSPPRTGPQQYAEGVLVMFGEGPRSSQRLPGVRRAAAACLAPSSMARTRSVFASGGATFK